MYIVLTYSWSPPWCMHECGECKHVSYVDIESLLPAERVSECRPACVRTVVVYVIRQRALSQRSLADFKSLYVCVSARLSEIIYVFLSAVSCRTVPLLISLSS